MNMVMISDLSSHVLVHFLTYLTHFDCHVDRKGIARKM